MKAITSGIATGMLAIAFLAGRQPQPQQMIENPGEGKDTWYDALPREAWSSFEQGSFT